MKHIKTFNENYNLDKSDLSKDQNSINEVSDDLNPIFIFALTHNELLSKIAKGEINTQELAKKELENRGFNIDGTWVGIKRN